MSLNYLDSDNSDDYGDLYGDDDDILGGDDDVEALDLFLNDDDGGGGNNANSGDDGGLDLYADLDDKKDDGGGFLKDIFKKANIELTQQQKETEQLKQIQEQAHQEYEKVTKNEASSPLLPGASISPASPGLTNAFSPTPSPQQQHASAMGKDALLHQLQTNNNNNPTIYGTSSDVQKGEAELKELADKLKKTMEEREIERSVAPITRLHNAFFEWMQHSKNIILLVSNVVEHANQMNQSTGSDGAGGGALGESNNSLGRGDSTSGGGNNASSTFTVSSPSSIPVSKHKMSQDPNSNWVHQLPVNHETYILCPTKISSQALADRQQKIEEILKYASGDAGTDAMQHLSKVAFGQYTFSPEDQRPWSPSAECFLVPAKKIVKSKEMPTKLSVEPPTVIPSVLADSILDYEEQLLSAFMKSSNAVWKPKSPKKKTTKTTTSPKPKSSSLLDDDDDDYLLSDEDENKTDNNHDDEDEEEETEPPFSILEQVLVRGITAIAFANLIRRYYVLEDTTSFGGVDNNATLSGTAGGGTMGRAAIQKALNDALVGNNNVCTYTPAARALLDALGVVSSQSLEILYNCLTKTDVPVKMKVTVADQTNDSDDEEDENEQDNNNNADGSKSGSPTAPSPMSRQSSPLSGSNDGNNNTNNNATTRFTEAELSKNLEAHTHKYKERFGKSIEEEAFFRNKSPDLDRIFHGGDRDRFDDLDLTQAGGDKNNNMDGAESFADDESQGADADRVEMLKHFDRKNPTSFFLILDHRIVEPLIRGSAAEALSESANSAIKCLVALEQKRHAAEWVCYTIFIRSDEFTGAAVKGAAMTVAEASIFGELHPPEPDEHENPFVFPAIDNKNESNNNKDDNNIEDDTAQISNAFAAALKGASPEPTKKASSVSPQSTPASSPNTSSASNKKRKARVVKKVSWLKPSLCLLFALVERCNNHITLAAKKRRKTVRSSENHFTGGGVSTTGQSTTSMMPTGPISPLHSVGRMNTPGFSTSSISPVPASAMNNNHNNNDQQQPQSSANNEQRLLDRHPSDRETIEFVMDVLNFSISEDGLSKFLSVTAQTYSILAGNAPSFSAMACSSSKKNPGNTLNSTRSLNNTRQSTVNSLLGSTVLTAREKELSGGRNNNCYFDNFYSGSNVHSLRILQRLVHMLSRMHSHYCAAGGGGSSFRANNNNNMAASMMKNPNSQDASTTNIAGTGGQVNENNNNSNHHHHHHIKEPCRCHTLVIRVVKLLNPLQLMNHYKKTKRDFQREEQEREERKKAEEEEETQKQREKAGLQPTSPRRRLPPPPTKQQRQVMRIERALSTHEISTVLEIVKDSLTMFVINPLGPSLATLRETTCFSAPSDHWAFASLDVNPYSPIMIAQQLIHSTKDLVLESVGIIYIMCSLPSLKKKENPQRMIQPLINSGALRALALVFSMFFSVVEPILFKHRIHMHEVNDADAARQREEKEAATRRRGSVSFDNNNDGDQPSVSGAQTPQRRGSADADADPFMRSIRRDSASALHHAQSMGALQVNTLGHRHNSIYVSSRPSSGHNGGRRGSGGAGGGKSPINNNDNDDIHNNTSNENAVIGDELLEFRSHAFEQMQDTVQVIMNTMLPFHSILGCMADSMSAQPIDLNDPESLILSKSPEEVLALYVLCDLAGISPISAGLTSLAAPSSKKNDAAGSLDSTVSNNNNNNTKSTSNNNNPSSRHSQQAMEEAVNSAAVVEGAGISTCAAILAFLRFQAIIGVAHYHYSTKHLASQNTNANAAQQSANLNQHHPDNINPNEHENSDADALKVLRKRVTWIFALISRLSQVPGTEVKLRLIKAGLLETLCVCTDPSCVSVIHHPHQASPWAKTISSSALRHLVTVQLYRNDTSPAITESAHFVELSSVLDDCCVLVDYRAKGENQIDTAVVHDYLRSHAAFGSESSFYHASCDNAQPALKMITKYLTQIGVLNSNSQQFAGGFHSQAVEEDSDDGNSPGGAAGRGGGGDRHFAVFDAGINAPVVYTLMCTSMLQRSFKYYFTKAHLNASGLLSDAGRGAMLGVDRNVSILSSILANSLRRTATSSSTPIVRRLGVVQCVRDLVRKLTVLAEQTRGNDDVLDEDDMMDEDDANEYANEMHMQSRGGNTTNNNRRSSMQQVRINENGGDGDDGEDDADDTTDQAYSMPPPASRFAKTGRRESNGGTAINIMGQSTTSRFGGGRGGLFPVFNEDPEVAAEALQDEAEVKMKKILRKHGVSSPRGFTLDALAGGALLSSLVDHAASAVESIQHHLQSVEDVLDRQEEDRRMSGSTSINNNNASQDQLGSSVNPSGGSRHGSILRRRGSSLGSRRGSINLSAPSGLMGAVQVAQLSSTHQYQYASFAFAAIASLLRLPFMSLVLVKTSYNATENLRFPPFMPVWFFSANTWATRVSIEEQSVLDEVMTLAQSLSQVCSKTLQAQRDRTSNNSNNNNDDGNNNGGGRDRALSAGTRDDATQRRKSRNRPNSAVSFRMASPPAAETQQQPQPAQEKKQQQHKTSDDEDEKVESSEVNENFKAFDDAPMIEITEGTMKDGSLSNPQAKALREALAENKAQADSHENIENDNNSAQHQQKQKEQDHSGEDNNNTGANTPTTTSNNIQQQPMMAMPAPHPPILTRRRSHWGMLAGNVKHTDNNLAPTGSSLFGSMLGGGNGSGSQSITLSPQILEKIGNAQLGTQQSCGFLVCVLSSTIEAPSKAIRLAKIGSNKEYFDDIRLTIASDEATMFAVQQAAKGYRNEDVLTTTSGSGGSSSGAGSRGRRGSFLSRGSKGGAGDNNKDFASRSFRAGSQMNNNNLEPTNNKTSSSASGNNNKSSSTDPFAATLTRAEMRVCVEQYTILLTRRREKLKMEQELNEMEIASKFGMIDRNSNAANAIAQKEKEEEDKRREEESRKLAADSNAQLHAMMTMFMLSSKIDKLEAQEEEDRADIFFEAEDLYQLYAEKLEEVCARPESFSTDIFDADSFSESTHPLFASIKSLERAASIKRGQPSFQKSSTGGGGAGVARRKSLTFGAGRSHIVSTHDSSTSPTVPNNNNKNKNNFVEATLGIRDALAGVIDLEYSLRSSIAVAETASYELIESREERAMDRMHLQAALASLPTSSLSSGMFDRSGVVTTGDGRRVGLVADSEGDAEFTRILKAKRETDRKVSRLKETQDALFTQFRESIEKEEKMQRSDVAEGEKSDFDRNIISAAAVDRQNILHRVMQVRVAALELLEQNSRLDGISVDEANQRLSLTDEFSNQIEKAKENSQKQVYVQYSWDPRQFYNNNNSSVMMMHHPTPPATSRSSAGAAARHPNGNASTYNNNNSRPSSAQSFHQHQQQQQSHHQAVTEMFEDTLCAHAMIKTALQQEQQQNHHYHSGNRSRQRSPVPMNNNNNTYNNVNTMMNNNTRPSTTPHSSSQQQQLPSLDSPTASNNNNNNNNYNTNNISAITNNTTNHSTVYNTSQSSPTTDNLAFDLDSIADFLNGEVSRSVLDPELMKAVKIRPASVTSNAKSLVVQQNDEQQQGSSSATSTSSKALVANNNNNNNNVLSNPSKALLVLDLSKHFLGDNGATNLAETIRINSLAARIVAVDLSGNGITDNGIALIIDALRGSPSLFELNLKGNNKITSKSGKVFARFVEETPNLRRFNLEGTHIYKSTLFVIRQTLESRGEKGEKQ